MIPPVVRKTGDLLIPPYCCLFCKSVDRKYFLDTGFDTEYDGRMYICNFCLDNQISVVPEVYNQVEMIEKEWEYKQKIADAEVKERRYDFLLSKIKESSKELYEIIKREERALNRERRELERENDSFLNGTESESNDPDPRTESDNSAIKFNPLTIDFTSGPL